MMVGTHSPTNTSVSHLLLTSISFARSGSFDVDETQAVAEHDEPSSMLLHVASCEL